MSLTVTVPPNYDREREYIIRVLFENFLGQRTVIRKEERTDVRVQLEPSDGKEVRIADGLFATPSGAWLTPQSLPTLPVRTWRPVSPLCDSLRHGELPVLFGAELPSGRFDEVDDHCIRIGADLIGAAFFAMTRYEESARPVGDSHGRFPASASVLEGARLLQRPIVNEMVEVLWSAISALWPRLSRPVRRFRLIPTHDVDRPFCVRGNPGKLVLRQAVTDVLVRRDPDLAQRRLIALAGGKNSGSTSDPCFTFDFIMGESERSDVRSAFYFLAKTGNPVDSSYRFDDRPIMNLMKDIAARGHEIGLHPSYGSFERPELVAEEFAALRTATDEAGVVQVRWGGRQHYLRWRAPDTWRAWDAAGLDYDSSVGFADAVGFRCGVCYEFPVFDLRERRQLRLQERPLVAMEVSLLSPAYAGLSYPAALDAIRELVDECRHYKGDFVLLWHNNQLCARRDRETYSRALALAASAVA
jgi:hypothetical protein